MRPEARQQVAFNIPMGEAGDVARGIPRGAVEGQIDYGYALPAALKYNLPASTHATPSYTRFGEPYGVSISASPSIFFPSLQGLLKSPTNCRNCVRPCNDNKIFVGRRKFSSKYKIDLLTVDGAGGGTGMSPWRMMNEWGVPPVELHSLLYKYAKQLKDKGEYVPAIAVAGGFTFEDQIFKGIALGAPFVKLIGMARSPIAAAMVGKTIGNSIINHQIPVYVERFGSTIDEVFVTATELRHKFGNEEFAKIPAGAIGLYTYYERLAQGLRQLMAGTRKFALEYISRNDLASITHEASNISGIPYIMDCDKEEAEIILAGK